VLACLLVGVVCGLFNGHLVAILGFYTQLFFGLVIVLSRVIQNVISKVMRR